MAELRPFPFAGLVRRMLRELEEKDAIFDLPARRFVLGDPDRDLSVRFHGRRAATPLGPAAGPQSQMAQNLVLSWLGGSRIHELKTVQIDDELRIPRPCIDMQTVGYNVEWSQELKLEQSLEEYVKGSMLIRILAERGVLEGLQPGFGETLFDLSVGYDLAGIQSERVQAFLRGARDCGGLVDRLRTEIPAEHARFRDLDFGTRLSETLTLSTFHGCPPKEIEAIIGHLLEHNGLSCIVKLNPMLLGPGRTRELLREALGYRELRVPDRAFERDTRWDEMLGFVDRLGAKAERLGLGFGVKFTNTLIVENHRSFFPQTEKEMYLSGPPLHVLAMNLVRDFRRELGDRYPISFSAGVDRKNFPDAVALGLVPVTVCSDLLKPGGYARSKGYFDELALRMDEVGARTVGDWCLRAYGAAGEALDRLGLEPGSPERRACEQAVAAGSDLAGACRPELYERWVGEARLLNTEDYVPRATRDPRYGAEANRKVPRKIGSELELFDCITCDKCVPVCPNDANFTFVIPRQTLPVVKVRLVDGEWVAREDGVLEIGEKHQIGNFADFCNDCGNCDVFCPEDGGPYVVKPRFFGSEEDWRRSASLDGFHLEPEAKGGGLFGRVGGVELHLSPSGEGYSFSGRGFCVEVEDGVNPRVLRGEAAADVDLGLFQILRVVRDAIVSESLVSYVRVASRPPDQGPKVTL